MSGVNRVVKNTGFLYAKMGITIFVSLYTTRLILSALGVADFGIFNIVGGAIAMLGFLNAAMSSATQRFMSFSEGEGDIEKQKSIFNISIVLHFIIAIIAGISLFVAGYFFFNDVLNIPIERMYSARMVYYFMILSTMITIMTVPYDAVMNAHENMFYYAIVGIIESLLKLGVAFIVVYTLADKLIVYGALMSGVSFIVMIILRVYCNKKYIECVIAPKKYYNRVLMKEMRSYAGWNLLGSSSGIVYGYGSNIMLNNFFGTILNAANGISGQINGQLLAFSNNMLKAINPVIVKAEGSGNRQQMFKTTFTACKFSVLIYAFLAIPFIVESSYILKLWLKIVPPFTEIFLQLMVIQVLIEQISLPLTTAIAAIGNVKKYNVVNSLILFSSTILLFGAYKIGLPPESLRYVQILAAICQMVYRMFYCASSNEMSIKQYFNEVIIRCTIVIVIAFFTSYAIKLMFYSSFIRLIMVCIISFVTQVGVFYIIVLSNNEKLILKLMIKNAKVFIIKSFGNKNFIE